MAKNKSYDSFPRWDEVEKEIFTPEEIAAADLKVALLGEIIAARKQKGISQKKLEELSGVRQPIIARMEAVNKNMGSRIITESHVSFFVYQPYLW